MKWLPIESAPKDGTKLLVAPGDEEPITIGWYESSYDKGWKSLEAEAWGGCECCGSGCSAISIKPTHWMPLPPVPAEPRYTITEAGRAMLRDAQQGVK